MLGKPIDYIEEIGEGKWAWNGTYEKAVEQAKEGLGEASGGKYLQQESWFWKSEVHKAVKEKRTAFKEWQQARNNERDSIQKSGRKRTITES